MFSTNANVFNWIFSSKYFMRSYLSWFYYKSVIRNRIQYHFDYLAWTTENREKFHSCVFFDKISEFVLIPSIIPMVDCFTPFLWLLLSFCFAFESFVTLLFYPFQEKTPLRKYHRTILVTYVDWYFSWRQLKS